MSVKFVTIPTKRLLQGITSASTTFYVNNILSFDGLTDVATADLGTQHYCSIRNDTGTILELMEIDPATISTGPITILRRGLSFYGDRTTETTALKLDWPTNSIVQFGTDVPQIFQYLKEYIDAASIAGAVPASTTATGIVEEGTQAEVDAGTTTGGTGSKLFAPLDKIRAKKYHDYAADSVGTDAYAITITPAITAYSAGQVFVFKAGTANTGACTLNVSALGAKTIKKNVSTDLETGDILANQLVMVQYDGTNMQLLSAPSGTYTTQNLNPVEKIEVDTTEITVGNTTTETTLFDVSIPADTLSTNNAIRIQSYIQLSINGGGGATAIFALKYGSTTVATMTLTASGATSGVVGSLKGILTGYLIADGATNAQKGALAFAGGDGTIEQDTMATVGGNKVNGAAAGSAAEDSTAAKTLTLTIDYGAASANSTVTAEFWIVEKIST